MSVTGNSGDPIPHGLKGYREPWECRCTVCRAGWAEYTRNIRAKRKLRTLAERDELAARRSGRNPKRGKVSESDDSDRKPVSRKRIGDMEQAVIDECALLDEARQKPTLVVAAKNLAKSIDLLQDNAKAIAVYNSSMKQLMTVMADLRGDSGKAKLTGRRKSGGRLATVGNLTKVKRGTA